MTKFGPGGWRRRPVLERVFLTQVLITDVLLKNPNALLLYLVPSKALVYEVSTRLAENLAKLDLRVTAVTPALVDLNARGRGSDRNFVRVGTHA